MQHPAPPAPACRDAADADAAPRPPRPRKRRPRRAKCTNLPRERLLDRGPGALSDDELIALLLCTGVPGHTVFDNARALLGQFGGSLRGMLDATPADFRGRRGIGDARIALLSAVAEIGRRALSEKASERLLVESPGAVEDFLRVKIGTRPHEVFVTLYLDARNGVVDIEESARGSLTRMAVYPREIVRRALSLNAATLVVAHNHPSGAVRPSAEDRRLTRVLRDALALVDVRLLDHIVVGASDTFSFARAGWL